MAARVSQSRFLTLRIPRHPHEDRSVLVTGGTGFLGSHLVEALLERPGAEVYALVRDPSKPRWLSESAGVRLIAGDLGSVPGLPAGLTCVYHLAGLTKTHRTNEYYTVNREGTANLLRALEGQTGPVRFVHLSSLAAAGPAPDRTGIGEDAPPRPGSPYGESKLQAEEEVLKRRDRFSVVILRAAAIYGPRDEDFLECTTSLQIHAMACIEQTSRTAAQRKHMTTPLRRLWAGVSARSVSAPVTKTKKTMRTRSNESESSRSLMQTLRCSST